MKTKIIGICICMLLIAAAVPAVTSVKINSTSIVDPRTAQTCSSEPWSETQKLLASDGAAGDIFGFPVSVDGDTAVIGACYDDDNGDFSGSAYVFIRSGNTWIQQAKLLPSDGAEDEYFGCSVSLSGDTVVIGADSDNDNGDLSGSAYVFVRNGTTWTQQAKLLASDGAPMNHFGVCASLYGDTTVIGAFLDDDNGVNSGSAYVFTRTGTSWTEQAKLLPDDGSVGDHFGNSISIDDDTALIGAYWDDDNGVDSGSAYVFTRTGTTWTQQTKLLASDGSANDLFSSWTISLVGDTAVIGAMNDDDNGDYSGSAYVFIRSGTTWTQQQKLTASDGAAGDIFGGYITSSEDTIIIAANGDGDNGVDSGSVYVFTYSDTTWNQQQKLTASDGAAGDWFGSSVSLDGDTIFIGAMNDDDNGDYSGSAYVFTKSGTNLVFSISGGLGVKLKIINNGTSNANDVPWQIHVQGGIVGRINKTVNGTVDVPLGESITIVETGLFFGLGSITITAKVAEEEKTAEGTHLVIFSMVKK